MSDEEDIDMDEIELPGKTYEFVNFVDPTYAERHIAKQTSRTATQSQFSHSSGGISSDEEHYADLYQSPFPAPETQASSRSLPGKFPSRTNVGSTSQPHLLISGSYSPLPMTHKSNHSKGSYPSNHRLLSSLFC